MHRPPGPRRLFCWLLFSAAGRTCLTASVTDIVADGDSRQLSDARAQIYTEGCLADPWLGYQCLIIRECNAARDVWHSRTRSCSSRARRSCHKLQLVQLVQLAPIHRYLLPGRNVLLFCLSSRRLLRQPISAGKRSTHRICSRSEDDAFTPHPPLPQLTRSTTECFEIDSAGAGSGFGQFVNYYASPEGVVFSAALRSDYAGLGYPNAPATSNGQDLGGARSIGAETRCTERWPTRCTSVGRSASSRSVAPPLVCGAIRVSRLRWRARKYFGRRVGHMSVPLSSHSDAAHALCSSLRQGHFSGMRRRSTTCCHSSSGSSSCSIPTPTAPRLVSSSHRPCSPRRAHLAAPAARASTSCACAHAVSGHATSARAAPLATSPSPAPAMDSRARSVIGSIRHRLRVHPYCAHRSTSIPPRTSCSSREAPRHRRLRHRRLRLRHPQRRPRRPRQPRGSRRPRRRRLRHRR